MSMLARTLFSTSVSLYALGCSSGSGSGDDAADSSSSGGSTSGPSSGTPSTTADSTGAPDPSATGESSETSGTADESTTHDTDTDSYGGDWCGNASTGRVDLPSYGYDSRFSFGGAHDGAEAFVGWVTDDASIQVAIYDVAEQVWGAPVTLADDYVIEWANDAPAATVHGDGNAMVAYVVQGPQPHAVVQRYDATAGTWSAEDLPGALEAPETGALTSAGGHAVFVAYDLYDAGVSSQPWAWFYDPAAGTWSEPVAAGEPTYGAEVLSAVDPEGGDAVLLLRNEADDVMALHHDAATGEVTSTIVDAEAGVDAVVAIGGGEFLALTSTGGFGEDGDLHAIHYAGGTWTTPQTIGSGYDLGPIRLVSDASGRAVASWNDSLWGTFARPFEGGAGWGDTLTANATNPAAFASWADHRVALDDEGFTIAYSVFGEGTGIRTWARRYEGGELGTPVDLAPDQPTDSRIAVLASLGTDRVRAVWTYAGESDYQGAAYACHTPISGWSEPVVTNDYVLALENRVGGEAVVVGAPTGGGGAYVDYYAAR